MRATFPFRGLPLLVLGACASGPAPESRIDSLQVLAITTDRPEAAPGEILNTAFYVANPEGLDYTLLTWTCTAGSDGCLEAESFGTEPSGVWTGLTRSAPTEQSPAAVGALFIPEQFAAFVDETPIPLISIWALACEPGACPILDILEEAEAEDGPAREEVRAALSDPEEMLKGQAFDTQSLGLRRQLVSNRPTEERPENPTVDCPDGLEGARGDTPLKCEVSGDFSSYAATFAYTTAGGFEPYTVPLYPKDTEAEHTWIPEKQASEGEAWVVITDASGGMGIWSGPVSGGP
jgi:hypothetical protein